MSVCLCMCMCTCVYVYTCIRVCTYAFVRDTHSSYIISEWETASLGRVCRKEYLVFLHDTDTFVRTCARAHVRQSVYKLHTMSISDTIGKWESAVFEGGEGGRGGNLAFFHKKDTFVRTCNISFVLFCPIYFVLSHLNMWVIARNLITFVWKATMMLLRRM